MSSLRLQILRHALPLLPVHSFSRQALLHSLPSLDPAHPDYRSDLPESVVDTLFGQGNTGASQALVEAWQTEGLGRLSGASVRDRLKSRLRYSSGVGEHLVEAYALLSAPGSSPSLPLPSSLISLLRNIKLPELYSPPSSPLSSSQPSLDSSRSAADDLASTLESASNRLPLLSVNPMGSLSYAWRIADHALTPDEKAMGVKKGIMDEPIGQGPEWYTSRASLMAAYLIAESRLLQPIPAGVEHIPNPHLPAAESKLDEHMDRYEAVSSAAAQGSDGLGQAMGYFEHLGRSAISLIKSRGI